MEPFVVEVLSNSSSSAAVKLVLQPESKDEFAHHAYAKVYGQPATEDVKLAFTDGNSLLVHYAPVMAVDFMGYGCRLLLRFADRR